MPHVLGIGAGGNQAYVNVGSGTTTYLGAGMSVTAQGAFQSVGIGNGTQAGNARGTGAVDLQTSRTAATQVASGIYSFVTCANNTASANSAVSMGNSCVSSANFSISLGEACTASGSASFATNSNTAASNIAAAALGYQTIARRPGEFAHSSGRISANGDAQVCRNVVTGQTTNATPLELVLPIGSTKLLIQNDCTVAFYILLVARRADADNESAGYEFKGVIDKNGTSASTALVGSVTKTVLAEDTVAWDANVTADTTNGAISLTVTGEAAKTIRWVASVTLVEVIG